MRFNWLGICYVAGAVLLTAVFTSFVATAVWVVGVPLGYWTCLYEHRRQWHD